MSFKMCQITNVKYKNLIKGPTLVDFKMRDQFYKCVKIR